MELPKAEFSIVTRTSSKAWIPKLIAAAGPEVTETYIDFFTATIRNRNTRQAYARACWQFFDWCAGHGRSSDPRRTAGRIRLLGRDAAALGPANRGNAAYPQRPYGHGWSRGGNAQPPPCRLGVLGQYAAGKGLGERRRNRGLRRRRCHVELRCRSRRADHYCRRPIGSSATVRTFQTRSKDTRAEPRPGPAILYQRVTVFLFLTERMRLSLPSH